MTECKQQMSKKKRKRQLPEPAYENVDFNLVEDEEYSSQYAANPLSAARNN